MNGILSRKNAEIREFSCIFSGIGVVYSKQRQMYVPQKQVQNKIQHSTQVESFISETRNSYI